MDYEKKELINALLECQDFNQVYSQYDILYPYILIDAILDELKRLRENDERYWILKQIYTEYCCVCHITDENIMLISDTHISSTNSNQALYYLNFVLKFCEQNQIKCLIHCGDIGDGLITTYDNGKVMLHDFKNQDEARKDADYVLENYPTSPYVTQLLLGGNHDTLYLDKKVGILGELAKEKKIKPLGYNQALITFNGHNIFLQHNIFDSWVLCDKAPYSLILAGHTHKAEFQNQYIKIPMLSNEKRRNKVDDETLVAPGFFVMKPVDDDNVMFERYFFEDYSLRKDLKPYYYQLNDSYHNILIKKL